MDLPGAVSAAGLVNNALNVLKSARELAKETSDTDLKERISEAYDVLLELKERVLTLSDEVRALEANQRASAAYIGPVPPHGYYYGADDETKEHPLCPKCYQMEPPRKAFLDDPRLWNGGSRRVCKLCGLFIYEKPMDLSPRPVSRRLHRS